MNKEFQEQYATSVKLDKKLNETYHRIAACIGISDSVFWTLYCLYESETTLTQNEISDMMGFPKQTINSAINTLVKDEYIYLEQKAVARNSKTVHLAEKGHAFCQTFIRPIMDAEEKGISELTDEEMKTFFSLAERLTTSMQRVLNEHLKTMRGEAT